MTKPPSDYRLLVPRDWFRIDLGQQGWRAQLKTFVDHQAIGKRVSAEVTQEAWTALRNTVEAGVRGGALELFLRPDSEGDMVRPASLMISLIPRTASVTPRDLQETFEAREREDSSRAEMVTVRLPAGEALRIRGATAMDLYVQMPGGVGYLVLGFATPLSGMTGAMLRLCESIAESLRWIT